jgi:hypothetical protein
VDPVTNAIVPAGAAMLPGVEGLAGTELRAARTVKGLYVIHGWGSAGYGRAAVTALRAMHVYSADFAGTPRYRGAVPVPELDDLGASGVGGRQRPRAVSANRIVTFGNAIRGLDNPYNGRLRMLTIELCDLK